MHCNEIQKHWQKGYALSFEFHIKRQQYSSSLGYLYVH